MEDLTKLFDEPSKEALDFTRIIAQNNHRYMANLHLLKMRRNNGEEGLEDLIKECQKFLVSMFKDLVEMRY